MSPRRVVRGSNRILGDNADDTNLSTTSTASARKESASNDHHTGSGEEISTTHDAEGEAQSKGKMRNSRRVGRPSRRRQTDRNVNRDEELSEDELDVPKDHTGGGSTTSEEATPEYSPEKSKKPRRGRKRKSSGERVKKRRSSASASTPNALCIHGKRNNGYLCADCPGKGICVHMKQKYSCKLCKGSSVCEHGKQRHYCVHCRPQKSLEKQKKRRSKSYQMKQHRMFSVKTILEAMKSSISTMHGEFVKVELFRHTVSGLKPRKRKYIKRMSDGQSIVKTEIRNLNGSGEFTNEWGDDKDSDTPNLPELPNINFLGAPQEYGANEGDREDANREGSNGDDAGDLVLNIS